MKKNGMDFLKLEEVAVLIGCTTRHIQNEIKRGNLKAFKPGKVLLFRREDVEKWILRKAV